MKNYCPSCDTEYQKNISSCPDCGTALLKKSPPVAQLVAAHKIYSVTDKLEQELIVSSLKNDGIRVVEENSLISQIPTLADTNFFVSVHPEDRKRALEQLRLMVKDGIISENGNFLD